MSSAAASRDAHHHGPPLGKLAGVGAASDQAEGHQGGQQPAEPAAPRRGRPPKAIRVRCEGDGQPAQPDGFAQVLERGGPLGPEPQMPGEYAGATRPAGIALRQQVQGFAGDVPSPVQVGGGAGVLRAPEEGFPELDRAPRRFLIVGGGRGDSLAQSVDALVKIRQRTRRVEPGDKEEGRPLQPLRPAWIVGVLDLQDSPADRDVVVHHPADVLGGFLCGREPGAPLLVSGVGLGRGGDPGPQRVDSRLAGRCQGSGG